MVDTPHHYVYSQECSDYFTAKLDTLHDKSCTGMCMYGHVKKKQDLKDFELNHNSRLISRELGNILLIYMQNKECDIRVTLQNELGYGINMLFYDIVGKVYLMQLVQNFPQPNYVAIEIFGMEDDIDISIIKEYWSL